MQERNQIISTEAERDLLIYMILVLIAISILVVLFFMVFQKRKNQLLIDQFEQKQAFEEELVKTQQEIQEETLKHVGRELHDNVGQLLAFSTMQMNAALKVVGEDVKSKVNNASEALKESLAEVRSLSKSLNSDVIFNLGLEASVKNEIQRLNKSGLIEASLDLRGEKVSLENKKDEIILFRILQEFFSNTIKYANAENIAVDIEFENQLLKIQAKDDGVGFNMDEVEHGSGITNMQKRAELINATYTLESSQGKGTTLTLMYPYKRES